MRKNFVADRIVSEATALKGFSRARSKPDTAGYGNLTMRTPFGILLLGLWFTRQWQLCRGQYYYPKPTILASSGEVILGGTATIFCARPVEYQEAMIFRLFKEGNSKPILQREVPEKWNMVDFSIPNATQSLGGSYVCNYCSVYNGYCSEYSDMVSFKIIGQLYPKPSIAVIPNGVVTEGQKVSILCEDQGHPQAEFFLHKGQPPLIYGATGQKALQGKATFPFLTIKQFHAGNYQCKYCYQSDTYKLCSDYSEQVQINIRDPNLPKPAIKVRPKEQISLGSNITIECWAPKSDLNFSLYNSNGLTASQATKAGRNMTEFIFSMVGLEYAGNYTCQYYVRRRPFLWSEPSDPVELLVTSQTQGINDSVGTTTIILASTSAGFLLLLLLLLLAFVLCRKRRKGFNSNARNQPTNLPIELNAGGGVEADEITYAELRSCSFKTKQTVVPDKASGPCIYASVAQGSYVFTYKAIKTHQRTRRQSNTCLDVTPISLEW